MLATYLAKKHKTLPAYQENPVTADTPHPLAPIYELHIADIRSFTDAWTTDVRIIHH